jgi:hypothetical protein
MSWAADKHAVVRRNPKIRGLLIDNIQLVFG